MCNEQSAPTAKHTVVLGFLTFSFAKQRAYNPALHFHRRDKRGPASGPVGCSRWRCSLQGFSSCCTVVLLRSTVVMYFAYELWEGNDRRLQNMGPLPRVGFTTLRVSIDVLSCWVSQ